MTNPWGSFGILIPFQGFFGAPIADLGVLRDSLGSFHPRMGGSGILKDRFRMTVDVGAQLKIRAETQCRMNSNLIDIFSGNFFFKLCLKPQEAEEEKNQIRRAKKKRKIQKKKL